MDKWQQDWAQSWSDQQRKRERQANWEIAAIVLCYLIAICGATGMFVWLSTHAPY